MTHYLHIAPVNRLDPVPKPWLQWNRTLEKQLYDLRKEVTESAQRVELAQQRKDDYDQFLITNPPKPNTNGAVHQSNKVESEHEDLASRISNDTSTAETRSTESVGSDERPRSRKVRAPHQKTKQQLRQKLHKKKQRHELLEKQLNELTQHFDSYNQACETFRLMTEERNLVNKGAWGFFFKSRELGPVEQDNSHEVYWSCYYQRHGELNPFCPFNGKDGWTLWTYRGREMTSPGPCRCDDAEAAMPEARELYLKQFEERRASIEETKDHLLHTLELNCRSEIVRASVASYTSSETEGNTYTYHRKVRFY